MKTKIRDGMHSVTNYFEVGDVFGTCFQYFEQKTHAKTYEPDFATPKICTKLIP